MQWPWAAIVGGKSGARIDFLGHSRLLRTLQALEYLLCIAFPRDVGGLAAPEWLVAGALQRARHVDRGAIPALRIVYGAERHPGTVLLARI